MRTALVLAAALSVAALSPAESQTKSAAQQGFERLKSLDGSWIDVDGIFGTKGAVAVTYKVTSGGHSVIETFPTGTPHEMVTVYHLEGNDLVLTHYCTAGNQPRMKREPSTNAKDLTFRCVGGTNMTESDSHMHSARLVLVDQDHLKGTWSSVKAGT